jgi:hypothetical protein
MVEEFGTGLKPFTVTCMENPWCLQGEIGEIKAIFETHWKKAESISEFKELVFNDNRLKQTQGYAELSKESDRHWYRVREMFGDKCFKTMSDAGAVMVANKDGTCQILMSTNGGDRQARVAVFHKNDKFNDSMMNFTGNSINGEFGISDYDCEYHEAVSLSGKYLVYFYEGMIAFVESCN